MSLKEDLNIENHSLSAFILLAWRVIMLLGLLGVAFQAGQERAEIKSTNARQDYALQNLQDISPRTKALEEAFRDWRMTIVTLAESRDVRIRRLENLEASTDVRLEALESRMKSVEDRQEVLRKASDVPPFSRKLVKND